MARFMARIEFDTNGGCWLWAAATTRDGYGLFRAGSISLAHRFSHDRLVGPVGDLYVLHHCDVPACVNPSHLFLGTQTDNMRDMHAKARRRPCRTNTKLTPAQVAFIRSSPLKQKAVAELLGVTQATISKIRLGLAWRDVPADFSERDALWDRREAEERAAEQRPAVGRAA
jgi:hypothetical protein